MVKQRVDYRKLKRDAIDYLQSYTPKTFTMYIPPRLTGYMQRKGWIEWYPGPFGCEWAITDAGKEARNAK